jgi:hypothetical protein
MARTREQDHKRSNTDERNRLVNAGLAKGESPKRFYEFALIDPVDQPFATFKYYYRTLGTSPQVSNLYRSAKHT